MPRPRLGSYRIFEVGQWRVAASDGLARQQVREALKHCVRRQRSADRYEVDQECCEICYRLRSARAEDVPDTHGPCRPSRQKYFSNRYSAAAMQE